ncbi:CS1 type fimbrial major subunit [Stenotrophomonas indicatrix]|uniref:CS1 type fimbrial major subunit n=1 Tax=Stenotrophomonas indicatrix TaxID=2045451 RepID=UPI00300A5791
MNIKKTLLSAAAALIIAPAASFAAETVAVQVKASVPASDGLQIGPPSGDTWLSTAQEFRWDMQTQSLNSITGKNLILRNSSAISAYLADAPSLTSGGDSIALGVELGGKALAVGAAAAVEVASAAQAATGHQAEVKLVPTAPTGGYAEGTYTGTVTMMFDSVVTSP